MCICMFIYVDLIDLGIDVDVDLIMMDPRGLNEVFQDPSTEELSTTPRSWHSRPPRSPGGGRTAKPGSLPARRTREG